MKDNLKKVLKLYLVSDQRWSKDFNTDILQALEGGITLLQLREKNISKEEFKKEILFIQKLTKQYHVPLIINDDVDLMLETNADGVHVGQSDMKAQDVRKLIGEDKILGVTAKTIQQALDAQAAGADYLGVGAVFGSSTKTDAKALTINELKEISQSVSIPVVAIGGIDISNIDKLKDSGIVGVAVVSGILAQDDIKEATVLLKEKAQQL